MKKTMLILCIAVLPVLGLNAQHMLIGGSLTFDHSKTETTVEANTTTTVDGPVNSSFGFAPFAGVFINDNFVVGLGLGYESTKSTQKDVMNVDEYTVSSNLLSFYPFARYYYMPTERAGLFLEGSIEVGFGKEKEEMKDGSTTETEEADVSGMAFAITPGVVIQITDYLALDATFGGLQYASFGTKTEDDDVTTKFKGSGFSFAFNPSWFNFGVTLELGK
ncbi:MAG TPA: outer membrane beta-barrel protein [Bacteroidales bacterium]|nr:outer membrane beta-barrel protein [Bacteroidales bacterium]